MKIEEINSELDSLTRKLESEEEMTAEDLEAAENRFAELTAAKEKVVNEAEKRASILNQIKNGTKGTLVEKSEERKEKNMETEDIRDNAEYRSAYLKSLQGKKLTEAEERAMTSAQNSVGVVIPNTTSNKIIERLYQEAPLLSEIELLQVEGSVTFAVETEQTDANIHVEGAEITEDGEVLIPVTLNSYEITKYITVSKTVSKMGIDAFEKWLTNMLAKRVARKITKLIISGTGTNQPTGVEKANTWGATNSVTVGKTASLTRQNVIDLCSLLPGAYDPNAKFLMSKKTLLTDFRPLQDKSKDDFFVKEGSKYYVEGYEVMLDDSVDDHIAYLGDFKMYMGNLPENVTVDTDKKLKTNSFEFLGCAMFDGKPALGEAFVKLNKATA